MQIEYLLYPYIINNLKNFSTDNMYFDTLLIIILSIVYLFYNNRILSKKIHNYLSNYLSKTKSKITFPSEGKDRSKSFKALVHFLQCRNFKNIKELKERTLFTWNKEDVLTEDSKSSGYDINQIKEFNFTEDIKGKITEELKEKGKNRENTEYKNVYILHLYSEKLELIELEKWIQDQRDIYDKFIRDKCCKKQLLLTVNWDSDDSTFNVDHTEWDSNITFDNSFFHNKELIMKKIDFFLNNKQWYHDRGIPYNLGILLYGEPGGGKTRFIKQLLNYTGRHGIDIKLTDSFDFESLKNIIHNEKIIDEFIIPQHKRIIIFEDIDAVGDTLKDRELKKTEMENKIEKIKVTKKKNKESVTKIVEVNNNNLSYFLNIIDGLNECSGRILIMTTNKIEYLDPAIIRPGRIDIKIEFKKCTIDDIYQMIKLFWKEQCKFKKSEMNSEINDKYTSAEVINIFRSSDNFDDIKHFFLF